MALGRFTVAPGAFGWEWSLASGAAFGKGTTHMGLFGLTIFVGAFLLFQVQPVIARFILPWFGGSAAVWTTCLLFFQVFLLAGYAYAHLSVRYLSARRQAVLHAALLVVALAFLPIIPGGQWKPAPSDIPIEQILLLLTVCLGLPYLVLAANGPLLQAWFSRVHAGTSPYRLYALSNLASLLALATYPFLVAPALTRRMQADVWAWSFVAFVVLGVMCAWRQWRESAGGRSRDEGEAPAMASTGRPTAYQRLMWFLWPACGSVLLLASTNKLCEDVASIPFLWVLPLGLYLLTFVLCFDGRRWYARKTFTLLLVPAMGLMCYTLLRESEVSLLTQVLVYGGCLFVGCMVCHGEVYRLKPDPAFLTSFYLWVAAGGAAGGVLVAVVAPVALRSYTELHWGLGMLAVLLVVAHGREHARIAIGNWRWRVWPLTAAWSLSLMVALVVVARTTHDDTIYSTRNFYGVLHIEDVFPDDPIFHAQKLMNGHICHGLQFQDAAKAQMPTTYFQELSGVAMAIRHLPARTNRRIGVVGLGVGTLAAYTRPGDLMRIYEINPQVVRLANTRFTYLRHAKGRVEVVLGDGRLSLEREPSQHFDLLVLDAFNSDAIPVHMLTREAFAIYLRHLKPDGVIAVQITNRHLNLLPVLLDLAADYHLGLADIRSKDGLSLWWFSSSRWILLSRDEAFLHTKEIQDAAKPLAPGIKPLRWTDDYTSLFPILKW